MVLQVHHIINSYHVNTISSQSPIIVAAYHHSVPHLFPQRVPSVVGGTRRVLTRNRTVQQSGDHGHVLVSYGQMRVTGASLAAVVVDRTRQGYRSPPRWDPL